MPEGDPRANGVHKGGVPGDDEPAGADEIAEALNEACRTVVAAARSGNPIVAAELAGRLDARSTRLGAIGQTAVATFVAALAALLRGVPVDEADAGLASPYRAALEAVAADIAAPRDPPDDLDWVAGLAARVATVLGRRDPLGARELANRLEKLRGTPGLDPDAAAYLDVLLDVLAGRDVRPQVLRLVEPYRSAYLSLAAVVRGADPRAGLVERVRDNATLVLEHGDKPARVGLTAVLAEVQAEAEHRGEVDLARFIRAVGMLVDGGGAPPDLAFGDPELTQAWAQVCQAWAVARRGRGV